jgi:membrane-bound serine protease (ClpP class)
MKRINILLPLFFFVLILLPNKSISSSYTVKEISVLEINSAITPATFDYLESQFKNLPEGALIVIKLNTPGGLVSTTKDIITLIGSQDKPLVIWITPEGGSASSAGAIIAASAHFILMSSGTNLGAATPVGMGEDIKQSDSRSKAMNDLKAIIRSLSQLRNRPAAPFEEMIDQAKSFTANEAEKLKIIDGVLTGSKSFIPILNSKPFSLKGKTFELELSEEVPTKNYGQTLGQKILSVLANPSTAYFLFILGVALIYFEFQAPGGYYAGGIGFILLILAAIAFQVLPLNWGAFALLILGVILLVLEIYVTSYGILGIGGFVAFVMGSLFLFHGHGGYISIDYAMIISTFIGILTGTGMIAWYLIKDSKRQKHHKDFFLPLYSTGLVLNHVDQTNLIYQIKVRGEIWKAKAKEPLELGDSIKVTSIDHEKLIADIIKVDKE